MSLVSSAMPKSIAPMTSLLMSRNGSEAEPMDFTSPAVLDLCTRRRSQSSSPKPEGARQTIKTSPEPNILHSKTTVPFISTSVSRSEIDSSEDGSVTSETLSDSTNYPVAPLFVPLTPRSKPTRPFKAYPKDPFIFTVGSSTADAMLGTESAEAYAEFRQKMLSQVRSSNAIPGVTNAKMRRSSLPTSTEDFSGKDASYWEKRRKNNEAAKRSRDARRAKEDEIAIRAAFLEQENLRLKYEVASLRNETTKLRCMLYN